MGNKDSKGSKNNNKENAVYSIAFHKANQIEILNSSSFKIHSYLIKTFENPYFSQENMRNSVSSNLHYQILECKAVLFFQFGDPLHYSTFIFRSNFKVKDQLLSKQKQEETLSFEYMLIHPFPEMLEKQKYLEKKKLPKDYCDSPVFQMSFSNDINCLQDIIPGFQYIQEIKGNVIKEIRSDRLMENFIKVLNFNYGNHFKQYFQLNDNEIQLAKTQNTKSHNFVYSIVSTFLETTTIFTLHRQETGIKQLDQNTQILKKIIEQDFSNLNQGKHISNKYFWRTLKRIERDNICYALQQHRLSRKGKVIKQISQFIRSINPYSPSSKSYRIVIYTKKTDNTQHYDQYVQSQKFQESEEQRKNLTQGFKVVKKEDENQEKTMEESKNSDINENPLLVLQKTVSSMEISKENQKILQNQDSNQNQGEKEMLEKEDQEMFNLTEVFSSDDIQDMNLRMENIEKDENFHINNQMVSSIYLSKRFQSV